jgi:hypothetical protein
MLKRKPEVLAPTDGVMKVVSGMDDAPVGTDYSDPSWAFPHHTLAYRRMRVSARDVELAESTGCELTSKVEVRRLPDITPELDAVMGSKPYEITRVEDRGSTCWLWLSEVACDGTCVLLSSATTYDAIGQEHVEETESLPVYVRYVQLNAQRVNTGGVDAIDATVTLRLRQVDYHGERRLKRGSVTLSVTRVESHGRWVDLTCRERGADRG